MDFNEEQVLISLREMEDSDEEFHENGVVSNGHSHSHSIIRHHSSYTNITTTPSSLSWLDVRVFYVKITKHMIDNDSIPEYLTLNHVPLNRDTLLEANGVRTSIYSDGVSTLLKRDRLDKKSEEVTFVSTDSIRMTGSVKFEAFDDDVLVLCGTLELCHSNGSVESSKCHGSSWIMSCDSDVHSGSGVFNGNHNHIEVFVAGCFSGSPIILTRILQPKRKVTRKGMLESIPEYEATERHKDDFSSLAIQTRNHQPVDYKPEEENYTTSYQGMENLEGEDGELSWFNAGVRVGVGIGLSICLGVGIGVGLLVRTYQGTTRNFRRRLL